MMVFGIIIGGIYLVTLAFLFWGSLQIPEFFSEEDELEKTKFSIIVPFRNEAENLSELLTALQKINYPRDCFEVIFLDDESEDESVEVIENVISTLRQAQCNTLLNDRVSTSLNGQPNKIQFQIIKNIRKSNAPKKDAITLGILKAKYDWIITTDADCIVPTNWLQVFHSFIIKNQPLFMAAPVGLISKKSLINKYQVFDFLSLQTVTMGSFGFNFPMLCNGANLCYKKEVFNAVNGYSGNNHISSGDDIFLLEKVTEMFPNKVHYLKGKEAIIFTKSETTWTKVMSQRIRWASKTRKQKNKASTLIGLIVFACNLLVIIGVVLALFNTNYLSFILLFWMIKLLTDYLFIIFTSSFFGNRIPFLKFAISSILYSIITVSVVFGSLFGTYSWKGRPLKK